MSVLDSIDTTVTLEWPGRRTIGTLVEVDGYSAVITALNAPNDGTTLSVTIEGETADEAVSIDGVCLGVSETAWGEQRIEMELVRVGTVCSASRLRDFVEEYGVASGGSVHIGASREQPSQKRFVYHVPERLDTTDTARLPVSEEMLSSLPSRHQTTDRGARPDDISAALDERRRSLTQSDAYTSGPAAPTASGGMTLPVGGGFRSAADVVFDADGNFGPAMVGDDSEIDIGDIEEKTINSDLAGGAFITGGSLDEAFRDALRAVDRPKMPEQGAEPMSRASLVQTSPEFAMDAVPVDMEIGRPVLTDDNFEEDELEPTRMLAAMPDDDPEPPQAYGGDFTETDLSADDVTRLKAAIDDAIAHERDVANSEYHDADEPIIVQTVAHTVPFAEPVQLGNDNRAPSMARIAPSPTARASTTSAENKKPVSAGPSRTSTARIERVAPSLAGSLVAPKAKKGAGNSTPEPATPKERKPSDSLQKIRGIFSVDMAIRCDLPATFQVGKKKKYTGTLIRLSESKLRLQTTDMQPTIYQRLTVLIEPAGGGKNKITLQCEITRIRESQEEGGPVAFDMRVSAGTNPPKQMNALRTLIQSFEAPHARRPSEASA